MVTSMTLYVLLLATGAWCSNIYLSSGPDHLDIDPDVQMADLPDNMTMQVIVEGGWVAELQLSRIHVVDTNLPVMLGTDQEAFVLWNSPAEVDDFAVYEDVKRRATIVIWTSGNTRPPHGMHGMMAVFDHHGNTYTLEPMDTRMSRSGQMEYDDGYQPIMVMMYDVRLTMTRVNRAEYHTSESESITSIASEQLVQQVAAYMASNPSNPEPIAVQVELLVVVDFAVFQKWTQKSRAMDYRSREAEAINNIRYHYAHALSAVAQKYKHMSEDGNTIVILPVALYIAKSAKASYWTELSPIKQEYHYTEAHQAVITFEKWIDQQEKTLPTFDLAILVTCNHLFNGYSSGRQRNVINGLSNVMSVCGQQRVLVSHDAGLYHTIEIAVRELGHSMGSYQHDTDCTKREKRTGTDSPAPTHLENELSEFSTCSKRAFWNFMGYMKHNNSNCLMTRHNYDTDWEAANHIMKHMGQRYTINEQCMMTNGRHSFYCGGDHRDQTACSRLYCWNYFSSSCLDIVNEFVADGTPCGNKQWCMDGECIKDPAAPMYHDAQCVHGDSTDIVDHIKGYKCYDMGINEPFRCYDSFFRRACCNTCGKIFNDNDDAVGCEYGDKEPSLCHENLHPSDCYDPLVADACCETCSRYTVNQPGCEYGDKAADCEEAIKNPYMCYIRNATCCWTCPRLQVGFINCEWGNSEDWCDIYPKSNCYEPDFARKCCATCNLKKDGPVGCEWGDRDSYCTEDDCGEDRKINCCNMCRTTTTSTTTTTSSLTTEGPEDIIMMDDVCMDTSRYCDEIKGGYDCYYRHTDCCNTCRAYEQDDPTCLFGDQISWCADYIRREGPEKCDKDPYIRSMCCDSCNLDKDEVPQSVSRWLKVCKDTAVWCDIINSGQCYDMGTRQTCCAKCNSFKTDDPKCKFGDANTWCAKKYCGRHSKECCQTCRKP